MYGKVIVSITSSMWYLTWCGIYSYLSHRAFPLSSCVSALVLIQNTHISTKSFIHSKKKYRHKAVVTLLDKVTLNVLEANK